MSDEGRDNLRLLPVARDDERILAKKETKEKYCRHRYGLLEEASRRLYCRECGEEVDPFMFLLGLSNERDTWRREGETVAAQTKKAARELAETERLLKNAKARLRKTGVEIPTAAARAGAKQLRALQSALVVAYDGDRAKAIAAAELYGFRVESLRQALDALDEALEAVGVRRGS